MSQQDPNQYNPQLHPIQYPKSIQRLIYWFEHVGTPIPSHTDVNGGVTFHYEKLNAKAEELGLKIIYETTKGPTAFLVFDPKAPDVVVERGGGLPKQLSAAQRKQFDESFSTLSKLVEDKDLSPADMDKIAEMRKTLKAAGGTITVVKKEDECFIGLSMAGNAKVKHAPLKKVAVRD